MFKYKTIFGGKLDARTLKNQTTEVKQEDPRHDGVGQGQDDRAAGVAGEGVPARARRAVDGLAQASF